MLLRRWLINLGLLAVLAVLALAVRLDIREEQRASRLTGLTPANVSSVTLRRAGEPSISLRRDAAGWRMLAPHAVPADAEAVARLLPVAQAEVARTLPAAGLDLAELGLEPAALRMTLDGLELRFGGTEPVAALRYVQVGDMVHLIEDRFLPRLMTPTTALVSRLLLPPTFSPGLGELDGAPFTAGQLAPLAQASAVRVESPRDGLVGTAAGARALRIASADGGDALWFRISDGGRRWTRTDVGLSWLFATPPLPAVADDLAAAPARALPTSQGLAPRSMPTLPQRAGPSMGAGAGPTVAVPQRPAPLPVKRLAPPAPGAEPAERRPTAAIPNLRDMARARGRNRSALPPTGGDPFAPPATRSAPAPPAPNPQPPVSGGADLPLRTEKRSP